MGQLLHKSYGSSLFSVPQIKGRLMKTRFITGWILLLVLASIPVSADSVQLGTTGSTAGVIAVTPGGVLAQSFTLTSTISVSAINVAVGGFSNGPLLLQLTNAIGPTATPANLLFQAQITPNLPFTLEWLSSATTLTLAPGNYFLIMSTTTGSSNSGWIRYSGTLGSAGSVGGTLWTFDLSNVNTGFLPASNWFNCGCGNLGFELVGQPVNPVPEPATLLLVGSGLAAGWLKRRKRI